MKNTTCNYPISIMDTFIIMMVSIISEVLLDGEQGDKPSHLLKRIC